MGCAEVGSHATPRFASRIGAPSRGTRGKQDSPRTHQSPFLRPIIVLDTSARFLVSIFSLMALASLFLPHIPT